jgi:hypothetical protein
MRKRYVFLTLFLSILGLRSFSMEIHLQEQRATLEEDCSFIINVVFINDEKSDVLIQKQKYFLANALTIKDANGIRFNSFSYMIADTFLPIDYREYFLSLRPGEKYIYSISFILETHNMANERSLLVPIIGKKYQIGAGRITIEINYCLSPSMFEIAKDLYPKACIVNDNIQSSIEVDLDN